MAGGSAVLAQRLLEAVFGDSAVRSLAARARADLERRADRLLTDERARFDELVEQAAPPPDAVARLRAAAAELTAARQVRR